MSIEQQFPVGSRVEGSYGEGTVLGYHTDWGTTWVVAQWDAVNCPTTGIEPWTTTPRA